MSKGIYVIKLGGHAMDDLPLLEALAEDLRGLVATGKQFVIVHGGGPHINALLQGLNIESQFRDGLRVTTPEILEAVEMALCGKVNKAIVRLLEKTGVAAAGISGQDGATLVAVHRDATLGQVGNIASVNPKLLLTLLDANFLPVVAPVALDNNYAPLNVNADTAAGAIAGALHAEAFVLISDVPGVLDAHKNLLRKLNRKAIDILIKEGTITGGMLPKVQCCLQGLAQGCKRTLILDGRQMHALARFVEQNEPLGTEISS